MNGQVTRLKNELSRARVYAVVITAIAITLAVLSVGLAFELMHLRDVVEGVV